MTVYLTIAENGLTKIGYSRNPHLRTLGIRGDSPIEVALVAEFETPNDERCEDTLHEMFGDRRIRGEWFALDKYDWAGLLEAFHCDKDKGTAIMRYLFSIFFWEYTKLYDPEDHWPPHIIECTELEQLIPIKGQWSY